MPRLLIVSNRMPWTVSMTAAGPELNPASGGLASGLLPWHQRSAGKWIGWPGNTSGLTKAVRQQLDAQLLERGMVPVHLSASQVDRFYHGFTNRVLWPLFHYLMERLPVDASGWEAYREVNSQFSDIVVREYEAGDLVWVQDYQLLLLPELLRRRLPEARIGFFLHIPFPSSEVFRTLPWRHRLLEGLLGADVIGFHTFGYLRHFMASVRQIDGLEVDIDRIRYAGREVRLGVFPMGVDAERFSSTASREDVLAEAASIRQDSGGRTIILGIDRLDYTKGIPRRLEAIERLLTREPELADQIRYIQIAVPSREEVDSYQRFKREVEERVGRINGSCGTVRSTPIHYVHQSVPFERLVALYRAADVMLVTPLRDGMNLVAKEFAASRPDGDGVLVLSEFAGAASELDGALTVNPYDIDGTAMALRQALNMAPRERRARMKRMRRRVEDYDVHVWARTFVETLEQSGQDEALATQTGESLLARLTVARATRFIHLLLDYDGTLVPFARTPELARPDDELLELLERLALLPGVDVGLVSGRPRETLEDWFGHLPISLWAEHGFWARRAPVGEWKSQGGPRREWIDRIQPILEQFTSTTPGSLLEIKSASIAWHYRNAPSVFGARQAQDLRLLLSEALRGQPFEVLEGKRVIEIRLRGISKAAVASAFEDTAEAIVVAIGDDHTDEDLFRALPDGSLAVGVGERPTMARFVVSDYREVRQILQRIVSMPVPELWPPVDVSDGRREPSVNPS